MMKDRADFEGIYQTLGRSELQSGSHGLEELGIEDLFGSSRDLFLGFYTETGLIDGLTRYGIFDELAEQGFPNVRSEICMNTDQHMLRFWAEDNNVDPLMELAVHRGTLRPSKSGAERLGADYINVLWVEWLQLQNPRGGFSMRRPPLPGQEHPGLGVGSHVMELLRLACVRLSLDGLITTPSYFHNALFYAEEFQYFDPGNQGVFLALCRDVLPQCQGIPAAASWAFVWNLVFHKADPAHPFSWFHGAQVAPISERLTAYFEQPAYVADVQRALKQGEFRVDAEALQTTLLERGVLPFDAKRLGKASDA